jgi:acetylornithine deacetylase
MSELVGLLRTLVAIDTTSVRPNAPLLDVLEPRLAACGFRLQRQRYVDERGVEKHNLIARIGEGTPKLALVGHSDCVPFEPSWAEALKLTERDGKLYGRGSCDTKAFIASAVLALSATASSLRQPVALIVTADEELGCIGAKKLQDANLLVVERAIIGEPTSLRPIRANKGYCLLEVEVRGQEGHSAYPETGANAIVGAARLISALDAFAASGLKAQVRTDFAPPFTTVNVGLVSGGTAKNVIAGHCRFTVEWRPLPDQPVEYVLNEVRACAQRLSADDGRWQASVTPLRLDRGFDTSADADVVQFLANHSGRTPDTVAFGTEGPQLAGMGAVPVVFGPGDIRVAHQTGEHVPVTELHACGEALHAALRHFCS